MTDKFSSDAALWAGLADPFALTTFNWCQDIDHYCGEKTCRRLLAHKPYRRPSEPTNTLYEHSGEEGSMMGQRLVSVEEASIRSRQTTIRDNTNAMPGSSSMTSLPQSIQPAAETYHQQGPHAPVAQRLVRLDATDDLMSNVTHGTPDVRIWPSAPRHEPVGAHADTGMSSADDPQIDLSSSAAEGSGRNAGGKQAAAMEAVLA